MPLPGDLADVVRREGAGGEEVVAAAALETANQLPHVRRVVVLGRARRAQLGRPELKEDLLHNNNQSGWIGPLIRIVSWSWYPISFT